ncbi:MAG TPA: DUF4139 domain-containing protein [Terriglobia bacterium]|nr:DUF4139 domain-containing protein [Terriglobia bacterium]
MHKDRISGGTFILVSLLMGAWPGLAQTPTPATATSTAANQKNLSVTVYNSDLALVRDVRDVNIPAGTVDLRFEDIAASIQPETVHIASVTSPQGLDVLEQNYEYDLLNPAKLLQKYVGKQVTLIRLELHDQSTVEVPVKATLLADNDSPVWQVGNEIVTGMGADRYVFPDLPQNLYSKPTLIWLLKNRNAGEQTIEASYLAEKIHWSADYVLNVTSDEKSSALNGWVTINNNTGTSFRDAQLQLVAGQVHQVTRQPMFRRYAMRNQVASPAAAPFAQESISEYHLYTLGRRTTLANNESKQISLLSAANIHIEKTFEVNGNGFYFRSAMGPGQPTKDPIEVHLKFRNSKDNSLGMPLPEGTVRVYQADSHGREQFIGEDHIGHTPKDEKLNLLIGNAFDVVEERKQTDYQSLGPNASESAYEITIRNHKNEPITVKVNEPLGGDWTMQSSNFKYQKTSAFSARFEIPVPANGRAVLNYRVRVRW